MRRYDKCPKCGKERDWHIEALRKEDSPCYEFCDECKEDMAQVDE